MIFKVLVFVSLVLCADTYKVLVLAPTPFRSLGVLGEAIVRHLVEAKHEVTFVTAFPKENTKNYRQIDVSDNALALSGNDDGASFTLAWVMENPQLMNDIRYLQDVAYIIANETFQNKHFLTLLQDPKEEFDVVISELYETELYAALAALYKCPLVWSYSMGAHWMALRLVAEATNPAFAIDYLSPEVPPFDFYGRLNKLWLQIQWSYIKWAETLPKEKATYERLLKPIFDNRGLSLPSYDDVMYNASLVLANDYKGNGLMPSTPQNFQFIGGYHVETPPKPLPENIQEILDNAKHGFIYFSMGSIWQSKDIPVNIINGLLKVFGELKETVIWKYEDVLPNLPKNVHILKWAPQPSILAHPKCLFFITHGGHLSAIETVHFGVPTIGIPIFFDQFININKAVANGYATKVDLTYNLHNDLKIAINNMLANSTFKEKAKELSQIYHDRLVPPGKELVHWVEHVVRTRGAPHLRSPALMLPWYQKMYLDVAAIIISVVATAFILLIRLFSRNSRKVNTEKKQN
ncbi:UDP-glucosyltransferase 2-like [Cydia fagiglandana]|uniref:UDP-glucosyltransferase 2-like n=1 Tax=Cydia fagiglandana TaxID=1458189 RepID=UPI002FEE13C5